MLDNVMEKVQLAELMPPVVAARSQAALAWPPKNRPGLIWPIGFALALASHRCKADGTGTTRAGGVVALA